MHSEIYYQIKENMDLILYSYNTFMNLQGQMKMALQLNAITISEYDELTEIMMDFMIKAGMQKAMAKL